jgi:hypothetical protein
VLLEEAVVGNGQPEDGLESAAPFFKQEIASPFRHTISGEARSDLMGRTILHASSLFFLTINSSFLVSNRSRTRGNRKDLSVFQQERASRETLATGTTPFGPMGVGSSGVDSIISGLTWGKSTRSTSPVVGSGLGRKQLMGSKSLFISTVCLLEETLSDYSVVS